MKARKTKEPKSASPKKSTKHKKTNLSGSLLQRTSQLENYKNFFQYLLSGDSDSKLADEI